MTQVIALLAVVALMFFNALGNFWFTYGIWPRSWVSFACFFISSMILSALLQIVSKGK